MFTAPTIAEFKAQFFRDFPYGTTTSQVMDQDITNAINTAGLNINPCLFGTQANYVLAYCLLAAHYLVLSLRASSQGIAGQYSWLQASKGVGGVNEAFTIPQRILDNPYWAALSKTTYGAQYLELVIPLTVAPMFTVRGHTKA